MLPENAAMSPSLCGPSRSSPQHLHLSCDIASDVTWGIVKLEENFESLLSSRLCSLATITRCLAGEGGGA